MARSAVVVEATDDEFFASVPGLPGCTTASSTLGEALDNVRHAIRLTLDYMAEHGIPCQRP